MSSADAPQGNAEHDPAADRLGRAIAEACPAGLMVVDEANVIRWVNRELERMLGYLPGQLLGHSLALLIPADEQVRNAIRVREYVARPEPRRLGGAIDKPVRGLRADGSEVPLEIALSPVSTANGVQMLAVVVDIGERWERERDAQRRLKAVERSNADLEQFASIASHDLREPLRMVVSYTRLLGARYRGQLDENADKFIGYAVEGALRMQRLIDDLLAYARLESAGRPTMPVAVVDALRDTLSDMRVLLEDTATQVTHQALPVVLVDPIQLAQLLQNLIHNAIKFRRAEPPWIELTAQREGEMWRLSVQDNGIGIEARYQERIFQMFQRLHERSKYDGNGIGLATAKKIVERHGGTIGVISTPGAGSTFYFTLPAANLEDAGEPQGAGAHQSP